MCLIPEHLPYPYMLALGVGKGCQSTAPGSSFGFLLLELSNRRASCQENLSKLLRIEGKPGMSKYWKQRTVSKVLTVLQVLWRELSPHKQHYFHGW